LLDPVDFGGFLLFFSLVFLITGDFPARARSQTTVSLRRVLALEFKLNLVSTYLATIADNRRSALMTRLFISGHLMSHKRHVRQQRLYVVFLHEELRLDHRLDTPDLLSLLLLIMHDFLEAVKDLVVFRARAPLNLLSHAV